MSTPLPDNGIPVKQGDPSFVFQGVYHPITWYGGEPYRPRVETLVVKNNRQVYLKMYDVEKVISDERLAPYELPGGSIDNDCDKITQAENEVNEEILVKVKNIYQTNIQYYESFSDKNVKEFAKITPLSYRGFVSEVFVAEYAGAYDTKNVEDKDLDPEMQKGRFYPITLIADKLSEPHLKALIECPFVDENVKFSLHMAQRKQGVTIENSHIITEANKPSNKMAPMFVVSCHYNSPFGVAVRALTASRYNHNAISFDKNLNEMYSFIREKTNTTSKSNNGFTIETKETILNKDASAEITVKEYSVPQDSINALKEKFKYYDKFNKTSYDFPGIPQIIFSPDNDNLDKNSFLCSTFVAACMSYCGIKIPKPIHKMTPEDVYNIPGGVEVYNGKLSKYSTSNVIESTGTVAEAVTRQYAIKDGGYYHNGTWNSIIELEQGGKIYRHRIECLVTDKSGKVYLQKTSDGYRLPGGSTTKDVPNEEQIRRECLEEAHIVVTNIRPTGKSYIIESPPKKWMIDAKLPVMWDGQYAEIYTADYVKADKSFKPKDVDYDDMYKYGKFYDKSTLNDIHLSSLNMVQITESSNQTNDINVMGKIRLLNDKLNSFKYGYYDFKKRRVNTTGNFNNYVTLSPNEFETYQVGVCWDFAEYEKYYFDKYLPSVKYQLWYIELQNKMCETHTFLSFNLKNKYYWFESAWGDHQGIHEFGTIDKLVDEVIKSILNGRKFDYFIGTYNGITPYHLTPKEYMDKMTNEVKSYKQIFDIKMLYSTRESFMPIQETKRSELPDSEFGIPEERKYPLDTEEHVRSAIKLFNHVEDNYEAKLAHRILKKMKEFGITDISVGEKNRFSKYYKVVSESIRVIMEADDDDDGTTTDYTTQVDDDDADPGDPIDYTSEPDDNIADTGDDVDDATDYTNEADEDNDDTESDTSAQSEDDTSDDDTNDASDDADTGDDDGTTTITADDVDDTVTDYADSTDDDSTDDSDDSGDDGSGDDTSDIMDDTGNTDENDESTQNNNVKNYNLILDFQNLYRLLGEISSNLETTVFKSPIQNISLTQIVKNMRRIKDSVSNYIEFNFGNDYVTNLYNYNIFVKALKLNLEMLRSTKDLEPDNSTNN